MWNSFLRKAKPKAKDATARRPRPTTQDAFGPPISPEEARANLSDLERKLNAEMKCHAGKNQVFIRSLLTGNGTTQPRITLKCHLRRDIGQKPDVFYEHIRDVCCCDPEKCEAYREFKERFVET